MAETKQTVSAEEWEEELKGALALRRSDQDEKNNSSETMLSAVLDFKQLTVEESMIHRNKVEMVNLEDSPEDILEGFITRDVILDGFDSFSTVSIYAGRYFDLGEKLSGRLSASVNNLFNTEYVRWASFFFGDTQRAYGYPTTFIIGLSLDF